MNKKLLMCRPTYFDIEYSINPYMDASNRVDKKRAEHQWEFVYKTLGRLGVRIELIEPVPGLPDMTFSGDCGLLHGNRVVASNFRHPERRSESFYYNQWLRDHGYTVMELPGDVFFEGLGDVVYADGDIIFASSHRSSPEALPYIKQFLPDLNVLAELEVHDESFYHSTLAFALIGERTVLYYPEAFTARSRAIIEQRFERRIVLEDRDAREHFVCCNVTVGRTILVGGCTKRLRDRLGALGYEVIDCDMSEFRKSGASVRCFVLNLS